MRKRFSKKSKNRAAKSIKHSKQKKIGEINVPLGETTAACQKKTNIFLSVFELVIGLYCFFFRRRRKKRYFFFVNEKNIFAVCQFVDVDVFLIFFYAGIFVG